MRRTQHAVFTVFPSVGITNGLRKVAIRVSPGGKLVTSPRRTHDKYPFPWPRVTDERRKPAIGTATTIAANPLNRIPILMKKPRRESVPSVDDGVTGLVVISFLQVLRMLVLRIIRSGIRLTGALHAARS